MQKLAMDIETNYSELKKKYDDALLKVSTLEQKLEDKGRKAVELVESHLDLTTALEGLNKEHRELAKLEQSVQRFAESLSLPTETEPSKTLVKCSTVI